MHVTRSNGSEQYYSNDIINGVIFLKIPHQLT